MQLRFKHDENYYRADCEEQGGNYAIQNIRIDFELGLADIPIKSMVIHPVANDAGTLWVDHYGNTNEFIKAIGTAIEDYDM